MFKIEELKMVHPTGKDYSYEFGFGLNYFQGDNDVGKTQFLEFIDFMFGKSLRILEKDWYKNDFKSATLTFLYGTCRYKITRTIDLNINYFMISGQKEEELSATRYKARLNAVFAVDHDVLEELKVFTDENLTYRTYSLFNFFEEKNQGRNYNFFTKLSEKQYMFKMPALLNYIFNPEKERINQLTNDISKESQKLAELEDRKVNSKFVIDKINSLLSRLNINILYKGNNKKDILKELSKINKFERPLLKESVYKKDLLRLKLKYNEIEEQLKNYESINRDFKSYVNNQRKRNEIYEELNNILISTKAMDYLIEPLLEVLKESEETITLSNNLGINDTIKKLRTELNNVKNEIHEKNNTMIRFKLSEKERAIATIQEYLQEKVEIDMNKLEELKKSLKHKKDLLKELKRKEDREKITRLSENITKYYLAASASKNVDVVIDDKKQKGFHICYLKNSDTLQPRVTKLKKQVDVDRSEENEVIIDYYPGSMARHTLIQLAGYLGFLKMLLEEDKYPLMPFLVIDHISQAFDSENKKGIGKIIEAFYVDVDKKDFQIIMLDQEESKELSVKVDKETPLVIGDKTGFNPFYRKV